MHVRAFKYDHMIILPRCEGPWGTITKLLVRRGGGRKRRNRTTDVLIATNELFHMRQTIPTPSPSAYLAKTDGSEAWRVRLALSVFISEALFYLFGYMLDILGPA